MFGLLKSFGMFSTKMILTFILVIGLYLADFAFNDARFLVQLQDFSDYLEGQLRDPPLGDQATLLWRTLVNGTTLLSILMTLIARTIIELIFWLFTDLMGFGKKDDDAAAAKPVATRDDGVGPAAGDYYKER